MEAQLNVSIQNGRLYKETLMSRRPGRIERPSAPSLTPIPTAPSSRIGGHCYPDVQFIDKSHTVAALRAAHKIIARDANWRAWRIFRALVVAAWGR
jgi:hypothetical protein